VLVNFVIFFYLYNKVNYIITSHDRLMQVICIAATSIIRPKTSGP